MEDEDEGAYALIRRGIKIVARKERVEGSSIFSQNRKIHIKAFKVEEVDPTGCGDSYSAAFVYGTLNGWELEQIGKFANAAGAVTATKRGSMEGIESLEDLNSFIKNQKMRG